MKKKILCIFASFMALTFVTALTACGSQEPEPETPPVHEPETPPVHEHTYSDAWSKDYDYHWHFASCEHSNEIADKALHTYNNEGLCVCGAIEPCLDLAFEPYKDIDGNVVCDDSGKSIGYSAIGMGTCTRKYIAIPKFYNNKPVISVNSGMMSSFIDDTVERIYVPETVKEITSVFTGMNLESVEIDAEITKIEDYVFANSYDKLKTVKLPESITDIGPEAFSSCMSLENVNIPAGVKSIGERAFSGCTNLKSLQLPEGLVEIGRYAFSGCGFETIVLPQNVTTLGERLFRGCSQLKNVTILSNIVLIDEATFENCIFLESVELPITVRELGANAFNGCRKLEKITYGGTRNSWMKLTKGTDWKKETNGIIVICSDETYIEEAE